MARGGSSSIAGPSFVRTRDQEGVRVKKEKTERDRAKQRGRDMEEDEDADREGEPELGEDGAPGEDVDQDAQEEPDQVEDDEEDGVPRGTKRARVNEDGDSRPGDKGKYKERIKTLPRDVDGYIPGSIVRIQLKNFVTYDFVEFCPGPYLNMILGPNGTGKSTIACSICLGLNWPPSILGRASDLNSFVKHGYDSGHIEIELKGPKGKKNLIIRRNLSARSKGSTFTLNGHSISGKEVNARMAELNVQVGNLCSFLPQDKVSEFAQMSPQQLLRETQRAAGDERLTAWHDTLIGAGHELKTLLQSIKEENDQLKTMQERNEGIERDVQRYKERKNIEHMIELLNVLIPVERYRMMRVRFMEVKARQRKLHEHVKKLKAKNEPAHALLKKLEVDHKEREKARDEIKKDTQAKFNKMKTKWSSSEKLELEAEDLSLKLDNLKKEEKDRVRRMKALEVEITRTREELEKRLEVKPEKLETLQAEMRQLNLERQDVIARKDAAEDKIKTNIDLRAKANVMLNNAYGELKKLDDVNVRKLQALQNWDRDVHDAVLWLRNNKQLFRMQVFEPPALCLTIQDRRFVQAIEGCFSATQIKTFVAQCQEDLATFNHYINDTDKGLGRRVRVATWFRPGSEGALPPPPMSREEMFGLGFDGYALDYVECPGGLRWWLQRELNFHRTAIASDPDRVDVTRAMEAVANPATGGGANFIIGTTLNQVQRSRYGRKAVSNLTREIPPARNLGNAIIDPEVKKRIDAHIVESQREITMLDEEKGALEAELNSIQEEDKVFIKRHNGIKARREVMKKAEEAKVKMVSKLKRDESSLASLKSQPTADVDRERIKRDLLNISKKRIKIAKEYTDLARSIIIEQREATRIAIQYLQIGANRVALQELCNRKDEKYQTALAEFNTVDEEFQVVKAQSKASLEESRQIMNEISPELREEYHMVEATRANYDKALAAAEQDGTTPPSSDGVDIRTLDELQSELETQQTNLELNLATNPAVVEQYEKRKRDIEILGKTIEDKEKKSEKIERSIKNARDNWQPALEKLVASIGKKFSAAFDRFGCAGEIRIREEEDYEKWAIDILVKFRDTEKLQLLTAQRQSGGERSLTTILYLLSLTEEARAPFSLVDEINQGMDQRAERTVHNNMVEVTCTADSAQYFLITPKLLPDLKYHERMKILCVNNGEWLPEEPGLGNMMAMIEGYLQRRHRGVNAQ